LRSRHDGDEPANDGETGHEEDEEQANDRPIGDDDAIPDIEVNGTLIRRLPGNLNLTIPGIDADMLIEQLPRLALSTGSACNTGQAKPSHVLTAIGLARPSARATIRIGLGRDTTLQSIADAAGQISAVVAAQRVIPASIGS